ncbi:hypothetical protein NQ318_014562 [Aromia moschata]|uniref:Uncharacterized protein n=1 Tax=Aromia moschata TaxID=1265417 RepID=A0AAV8XZA4_9CUCU|nr:hypothetical protein NQ318_014562 [Aromia moschata]
MHVYPAHKFWNGLNGLKKDVKQPKTIRAPDGPQRQKRTKTLKKIACPIIQGPQRNCIFFSLLLRSSNHPLNYGAGPTPPYGLHTIET